MIEEKDIEKLNMSELVAYYNANNVLKNYYANEVQMNICYQHTKESYLFNEPAQKQMRCNEVETKIMQELEKRLL